jgi:hypothetical protein
MQPDVTTLLIIAIAKFFPRLLPRQACCLHGGPSYFSAGFSSPACTSNFAVVTFPAAIVSTV